MQTICSCNSHKITQAYKKWQVPLNTEGWVCRSQERTDRYQFTLKIAQKQNIIRVFACRFMKKKYCLPKKADRKLEY